MMLRMRNGRFAVLLLGGLLCTAGVVQAQNLLTNGDFEATVLGTPNQGWVNPIPGWTEYDPTGVFSSPWAPNYPMPGNNEPYTGIWNNAAGGADMSHSGNQCYAVGQNYPNMLHLYQDVATNVGQDYLVSFWAMANEGTGDLDVTFDGQEVESIIDGGTPTYTQYSQTIKATDTTSRLDIGATFYEGTDAWYIDDVSVTATAVPEPGMLALLASGLLGAAIFAWRKRK